MEWLVQPTFLCLFSSCGGPLSLPPPPFLWPCIPRLSCLLQPEHFSAVLLPKFFAHNKLTYVP